MTVARGWKWLGLAAAVAGLAITAYWLLWTTLMVYDDEGYVLYSLRAYASHGHLYDLVYTQYGPFFYVALRALHALGLPFTNIAARELALVCWVGAAALAAATVWRQTRSNLQATLIALAGTFVHLWPMTSEPSHPGGFIALAVAFAAWVGLEDRWAVPTRAAVVGAIGAALVLTKINVGIFLLVGAAASGLLNWPAWGGRAGGRALVVAGLGLLPVLLMKASLSSEWVRIFATTTAVGGMTVAAVAPRGRSTRAADLAAAGLAAGAVGALTIAAVLLTGTTVHGLLEGVLLGPLRHPMVYSLGFRWRTGTVPLTALSAGIAGAWWFASRHPDHPWGHPLRAVVLVARITVAAVYVGCGTGLFATSPASFVLSYGIATAWLWVVPTTDEDRTAAARSWLALLLVLQSLHAFPVAGSQISWGTFLAVPLFVLGLWEVRLSVSRPVRQGCAWLALTAAAGICASYAQVGWQRYRGSTPLRLPGAETLRLPESTATALHTIVRNAQVHGDVLFTLPGMQSLNAWSGVPQPTIANTTHWFSLLSAEQQHAIQERLEASPRSVLVVERFVYDLLEGQKIVVHTPLLEWLLANYRPVFELNTYEFWVRRDRRVAAVDTATLLDGVPGASARYQLQLVLAPPSPIDVGFLELRQLHDDGSVRVMMLTNANAAFVTGPVREDGTPARPPQPLALPIHAAGLTRLEVFTNEIPADFSPTDGIVYLHDPHGRRVGEARFVQPTVTR